MKSLMPWARAPLSLDYYCDESSIKGHKYAAIGGLAVPDYHLDSITTHIAALKHKTHTPPGHEIKWEGTSKRRDCPHTEYAKYLGELVEKNIVNLHILFAPFSEWDHATNGTVQSSVGRIYNTFLVHQALRYYGPGSKLCIQPDGGDCTAELDGYKASMQTQAKNREQKKQPNWRLIGTCVKSIDQRDSKETPLLQLLDVTLGAFCALRNERKYAAGSPKEVLAGLIFRIYGRPDLAVSTDKDKPVFSVWNLKTDGPRQQQSLPGIFG